MKILKKKTKWRTRARTRTHTYTLTKALKEHKKQIRKRISFVTNFTSGHAIKTLSNCAVGKSKAQKKKKIRFGASGGKRGKRERDEGRVEGGGEIPILKIVSLSLFIVLRMKFNPKYLHRF